MGFRWYKGRFLSDSEYSNILEQESNDFWKSVGILIPTILGGLMGYNNGNFWLWTGIIVGALIGIVFNRLFVLLSYITVAIFIIYLVYKLIVM
jgi:hypothetical protein